MTDLERRQKKRHKTKTFWWTFSDLSADNMSTNTTLLERKDK